MASGFFLNGLLKLWNGGIDLDTDTIKIALTTSSYTADLNAHDFFDDVTNEVSGTGYTAGGATLGSVTLNATAANSWGTTWAVATAYTAGQIVKPSSGNGYVYRCVTAGTSHGSTEPTWPTVVGTTVSDNGVVWVCFGTGVIKFDAADASWSTATITARYAVIYKSTGTASSSPVIYLYDFGSNQSSTAATFQVTFPAQGIFHQGNF